MFCRGEDREFLSWQKRDGESPEWPRGALVRLAPGVVQKGSRCAPKAVRSTLSKALSACEIKTLQSPPSPLEQTKKSLVFCA